jgi:hypothetical protein
VGRAFLRQWHEAFEAREPDGHQAFLEWLRIPAAEVAQIRSQCQK